MSTRWARSGARPTGGANRFDPVTKTWMHFESVPPGATTSCTGRPTDAEGNGWWTQYTADKVVKADPKTGKTYEVVMRPPWVDVDDVTTAADREWYTSMGAMTWGNINTVPVRPAAAPHRGGQARRVRVGAEQCRQQRRANQHPHARGEVLPGGRQPLFRHRRQGLERLDEPVQRREGRRG